MNNALIKTWRWCIGCCLALAVLFFVPVTAKAASDSGSITSLAACSDKLSVSWVAKNGDYASGVNGSCATATSTTSFEIVSAAYDGWLSDYDTTVTVTLTNSNSKAMNLDFSVSGSAPTITAGSGVVTNSPASGYSYTLDNGESITIKLYNSSTTAIKTTVSGIQFYSNEDVNITFVPSEHGSYSLTVGSETISVTDEAGHTYGYSSVSSASVSADSGYVFKGWMTSAGTLLEYRSGTNLFTKTSEDTTVYAYFVPSDAPKFQVGTHYYYYWTDAFAAAAANSNATVILVENGTLPNRVERNKVDGTYVVNNGTADAPKLEYKIPSGAKFVIPYSSADTGDFDGTPDAKGKDSNGASIGTRSAYRTLTVNDGVTVSCAGSMNLNAQQFATSGNTPGCVLGQYGLLKLNGTNAKLNVSGNLYCYGYITGSGSVEMASGGKLYELMQLMDWRGGNAASSAINQNLFPFSQYFVQNVETDLIMNSGAASYVCVALEAGLISKSVYRINPEYIGSSGFFQLGSGAKLIRDYDTANDCLNYTVSGGAVTMSGMELSLGDYSMNTADFIFAITPNMNLTVEEDAAITLVEDYKLLPNVTVVVDGDMTVQGDVYIYDYADWVTGNYAYDGTYKRVNYIATTGKGSSRTLAAESASMTVNGTLTVTGGIYTTSGKSSTDKVIKGTGSFENTPSSTAVATVTEGTQYNNGTTWETKTTSIAVSPVLGNLAGVGDLQSFGTGTYYGLGSDHNDYWYTDAATVAATCTEGAYTAYSCTGNSGVYKVHTSEAIDHTPSSAVTENEKAATCGAAGSYDSVVYCAVCGEEISRETVTVNATGSHNYSAVVTAPTCSESGYTTYTCSACGDSYTGDATAATGHSYTSEVTTQPTCTKPGVKTFTCSACGDSYTEEVSATGHTEVTVPGSAATCTATGLTDGVKCSACGEVLTAQETIPATGHTEGAAVEENRVEATATEDGSYDLVVYCTVCGEELSRETKTISAIGSGSGVDGDGDSTDPDIGQDITHTHTPSEAVKENEVSATCTADGSYESVVYCETCGEEVSRTAVTVPATGEHSYDDGVVTTEPTCTEKGERTYTCSECGKSYTEEIAALGHTAGEAVKENRKEATETENGSYDSVVYCTVCKVELSRETVTIPATGSTPVEPGITTEDLFDNRTGSTTPATIAGPDSWTYNAENTFTVSCEKACIVACTTDGGETYTRLTAAVSGDAYSFTVTLTENMRFVVAIKGDVYEDGLINNKDLIRLRQIVAGIYVNGDEIVKLCCNVYTDDLVNNKDLITMRKYVAGTITSF